MKMKILTFVSCKEHCKLYAKVYGLIPVNSCHQIQYARKGIILVSDTAVIAVMLNKAGSCAGVEDRPVKFTFSAVIILLMILT